MRARMGCVSPSACSDFGGRFVNRPYGVCAPPLGRADFPGEHSSPLRGLRFTVRVLQKSNRARAGVETRPYGGCTPPLGRADFAGEHSSPLPNCAKVKERLQ